LNVFNKNEQVEYEFIFINNLLLEYLLEIHMEKTFMCNLIKFLIYVTTTTIS
jgi:hypothetical protein